MRIRGSALIITLAVLSGLIAILASAAATHQFFVDAESNRLEKTRARMAAMSGIQNALQVLYAETQDSGAATTDTGTSGSAASSSATTLQDAWATFGQTGAESFTVGNAKFRAQIVDMSGRVNFNSATEEQLQRLPLTSEQIDSLLDFREPGQDTRPEGGKDAYYNGLTTPYNTKLRPFDTVDELLQVKGFTPDVLFQPQTQTISSNQVLAGDVSEQPALYDISTVISYSGETSSAGTAKQNINNGSTQQKLQRFVQLGINPATANTIASRTWTSIGQLLQQTPGLSLDQQKQILDTLTIANADRSSGKININTAPATVLVSIPGMTPDIATAIVTQQQTGFTTLGDVLDVAGVTGDALQIVDFLTVNSQTFLVRCLGTSGGATVALEAIIDVQNNTPKIMQITQPPYSNVLERWGWNDTTTTDTVLKDSQ